MPTEKSFGSTITLIPRTCLSMLATTSPSRFVFGVVCTNEPLINNPFKNYIPKIKQESFDLIFFDGHHDKSATIEYFEALLPKANNNSIFIFDDIYWSQEMTQAWDYIKNHNSVTVTVDTFHFGIVFFRKEQVEEHFKIRM